MFGIINYGGFLISGILLNVTPGADTMYILGIGMAKGRRAGMLSALGISTGCLAHTALAAFGLSVVLQRSMLAFSIVKYCGAAYLIYLGIRAILAKPPGSKPEQDDRAASIGKIYFQGVLTNVLNPKVALFFLAYLPQFISEGSGYGPLPFFLLGISFVATGTLWGILLALFSSGISERFLQKKPTSQILNRICGIVFVLLGVNLLRVGFIQ